MLDCALWEVEMVEEDYAKREDQMARHRQLCSVVARHMHEREFAPTDMVRKLYKSA